MVGLIVGQNPNAGLIMKKKRIALVKAAIRAWNFILRYIIFTVNH